MTDRVSAIAQGRLILVVEDNLINQKVIFQQLKTLGFAADVANDGQEGLKVWQSGEYALLLSDLNMPNMDGFELTKAIRAGDKKISQRPVIAVTANVLNETKEKCMQVGLNDYLSKPLNLKQLKEKLDLWLPRPTTDTVDSVTSGTKQMTDTENLKQEKHFDANELKNLIGDDMQIIEKFVREYRATLEPDRDQVQKSFANESPTATANIAHRMKSSARVMGAMSLGNCCERIEKRGKSGVAVIDGNLLEEFNVTIAKVIKAVDEFLQNPV